MNLFIFMSVNFFETNVSLFSFYPEEGFKMFQNEQLKIEFYSLV